MSKKKVKRKKKIFEYVCIDCSHIWRWLQGDSDNRYHVDCPGCGSFYYNWLNYKELFNGGIK